MHRVTDEKRDCLAYERNRRRDHSDTVKNHYNELSHRRSDDRAASAIAQLEGERTIRSLRDELPAARQDIPQLRHQFASLGDQTGSMNREHSTVVSSLELDGLIRVSNRPRSDGTGGDVQRRT